jgi:hypothetical protein
MEAGTTPPEQNEGEGKVEVEKEAFLERLNKESEKRKQAEDELSELRSKIVEFEDRDKSETERERAARLRAEEQLTSLQTEVTSLKKGSWVRSAAAEFNFFDPEDAVAHLGGQLADLEDQREARKVVERLAKQKEHLVRSEKQKPRPEIGKVYEQQAGNGGQQGTISPQQAAAMSRAQQEQEFAEGLAQELGKFTQGWYTG